MKKKDIDIKPHVKKSSLTGSSNQHKKRGSIIIREFKDVLNYVEHFDGFSEAFLHPKGNSDSENS